MTREEANEILDFHRAGVRSYGERTVLIALKASGDLALNEQERAAQRAAMRRSAPRRGPMRAWRAEGANHV